MTQLYIQWLDEWYACFVQSCLFFLLYIFLNNSFCNLMFLMLAVISTELVYVIVNNNSLSFCCLHTDCIVWVISVNILNFISCLLCVINSSHCVPLLFQHSSFYVLKSCKFKLQIWGCAINISNPRVLVWSSCGLCVELYRFCTIIINNVNWQWESIKMCNK